MPNILSQERSQETSMKHLTLPLGITYEANQMIGHMQYS